MTDIFERSPAHEALMNYQQGDMDGIMVMVSRQAIHEVDDGIKRLRAEAARWKDNCQSGWAALHMVREALTVWCIPGTLASSEYADGPTQQHEAEQLIAAISRLKDENDRLHRALEAACSKGCDHCADEVRSARAALSHSERTE